VTDTAAAEAPAESVPPAPEAAAATAPLAAPEVESDDNQTAREPVTE
jgi:hypothetical protein